MKIKIGTTVTLIPFGDVALPDYGQRKLEVLETIELDRVIVDGGGSMVGVPFSVNGVLSVAGLAALSALTNAPVGTFTDVLVEIESAGAVVWSGRAYPQQITGVTLRAGEVLYADVGMGLVAGDRLANVTVNLLLKEMN